MRSEIPAQNRHQFAAFLLETILLAMLSLLFPCSSWAVDCYEEIDPYYWGFDVPSMIQIHDPYDVDRVRSAVIEYLWRDAGFPATKMPAAVTTEWDTDSLSWRCSNLIDPSSIEGLVLWLDACDPGTLITAGDRVVSWQDKSGYGNHAGQPTAAYRPRLDLEGINGHPAVYFDGTDDFIDSPGNSSLDLERMTAFIVLRVVDPHNTPFDVPLAKSPAFTAYTFTVDYQSDRPSFRVRIGDHDYRGPDYLPVSDAGDIWTGWHDGVKIRLFRGGAEAVEAQAEGAINVTSGPLRLGNGGTNAFDGYIAEVLLYNRALADSTIFAINNYLGCKYEIQKAVPTPIRYLEAPNLDRVERLDIAMDYDLHSYAYLLTPKTRINRLLVFHQGHGDYFSGYGGKETIDHFLELGYAFLTFWMPLYGENSSIAHDVPGYGDVSLYSHDQMATMLENSEGSFIRFFLEPVIVGLNYADATQNYYDVNMMGISGGGWTTHLIAALDDRIELSFPVAGSLPLYLRSGPCPNGSQGDSEQYWPALYEDRASWLDLYILGGYGARRQEVQVLNKYDNCCFWGINYRTYDDYCTAAVAALGAGEYYVELDSTHAEHKISVHIIQDVMDPLIGDHVPSGVAPAEPAVTSNWDAKPNPSGSEAMLSYSVKPGESGCAVAVLISTIDGRLIRQINSTAPRSDKGTLVWDGKDEHGIPVPAGVYAYALSVGDRRVSGRMVRFQ